MLVTLGGERVNPFTPKSDKHINSPYDFKGATSRFVHLQKISLNFSSSSFAIRVNLLHPHLFLFLFGLVLPIWCLSTLTNYYF